MIIDGNETALHDFPDTTRRGVTLRLNTDAPIQWLLKGDPAIRWQTLRDLVGATDRTFDRERRRFHLTSVHPRHTVDGVIEHTGFAFEQPNDVPITPAPSTETLRLLRSLVAPQLAETYPQFAADVFGLRQPA